RLRGDPARGGDDLLAEGQARGADPDEADSDDERVVVLGQLAAEVDRDAGEDVVPEVAARTERSDEPLVARLLEVGRVNGVVDVAERVQVAPADLDSLLVRHRLSMRALRRAASSARCSSGCRGRGGRQPR